MEKRAYIFYLEDMVEAMEKIARYVTGLTTDEFIANEMAVDATIRNLEIIGEAANTVPKEVRVKYPNIPWSKMYRLRNIAIHHYHGIDYAMIWEIAANNLPQNKIDLEKVIEKEKK
jgi:uncharacterized protein with HEPN domain